MRYVVVQLGARRGYAVPLVLEQAGLLDRFYTDLAGNVGLGRWLVKCGPFMGLRRTARKLAGRRVPEAIRKKTRTFAGPTFWFSCNWALCGADLGARFREQLRWNRAMGSAMVRQGFGRATHLYSMLGECAPFLIEAKRRGLTVLSEIYILLSAERILERECASFPEWEAAPPDFRAIRNAFPEQEALLTQSDFAVCPSERVQADLVENFGFGPERAAVVPYGIDESWFGLESRPVIGRILFVGTAGLRKGIHYLAMAAEELHTRGRGYVFQVAGDVAPQLLERPECRHLVFLGRLDQTALREQYATADVFVLPSLAEGSALASYEALAAALPVIATPAVGSVVRDGLDGRIVPERDPRRLALAIESLVEKRLQRASMAAAARQRARDFTLQAYARRLLATLGSVNP